MKGQISMEMLITVGMVLAFTLPIVLFLFTATSSSYEETTKAQADAAARVLSDVINEVYSQGSGAKKTIALNLPSSTKTISVKNGEVIVVISSGAVYTATYPVFAEIDDFDLSINKGGLQRFEIINDGSTVQVILR